MGKWRCAGKDDLFLLTRGGLSMLFCIFKAPGIEGVVDYTHETDKPCSGLSGLER